METVLHLLEPFVPLLGFVVGGSVLGLWYRRNDIADVFWGLSFVALAWWNAWAQWPPTPRAQLALGLVSVWGLRLSVQLGLRVRRQKEDRRYARWRTEWGRWAPLRSVLQVYVLQPLLLAWISLPSIALVRGPLTPWSWADKLGVFVFAAGFGLEVVSDIQLDLFKREASNRGKLFTKGLRKFVRFPSYLGEILMAWALWLMCLAVPGGWITIVGPLLLTFLLFKVSGASMLDRHLEEKPGYRAYANRVPAIFPGRNLPIRRLRDRLFRRAH